MTKRNFYAVRPESSGQKVYRFDTKSERDSFVTRHLHARPLPSSKVPGIFRIKGVNTTWGDPQFA